MNGAREYNYLVGIIWYKVFHLNTHNFRTDLFKLYRSLKGTRTQGQGLRVIAVKGYSILPRDPEFKPHHQKHISVIIT